MHIRPLLATAVFLVVGSLAAGCGGGGTAPPTTVPVAPTSVTGSAPLTPSGGSVTFPDLQGYGTVVTIPAAAGASGSLSLVESTTLPDGLSAATASRRSASVFATASAPLLFVSFVPSANVTLAGIPGFTITSARPFPAATYGVAFYDPATGWRLIATLTAAGNTLHFSGTSAPIVLAANVRYAIEVAVLSDNPSPSPSASATPSPSPSPTAVPTATPSPTATPTSVPTPTPTPTAVPTPTPTPVATPTPTATPVPTPTPTPLPSLTFSATSMQFNALNQTQTLTLSSGPSTCCATYTATSSDTNVATVAQTGNGTWTITSVNAGAATITLSTAGYQPYQLPVSVAQVILVPQSLGGHR